MCGVSIAVVRRLVMRAAKAHPEIQVVAINDPFIPVDYMEYMFKVLHALLLLLCT